MVTQQLSLFFRNACASPRQVRRYFPDSAMEKIEAEISRAEAVQSCEIRFAVETSLPFHCLKHDDPVRRRALDLFSQLGVWDTSGNNGLLFYLLLSEKRFEIVTDRSVSSRIPQEFWNSILKGLPAQFQQGRWSEGVIDAIAAIAEVLKPEFPPAPEKKNQLPDRPVVLR